jgi:hypothetical protein
MAQEPGEKPSLTEKDVVFDQAVRDWLSIAGSDFAFVVHC